MLQLVALSHAVIRTTYTYLNLGTAVHVYDPTRPQPHLIGPGNTVRSVPVPEATPLRKLHDLELLPAEPEHPTFIVRGHPPPRPSPTGASPGDPPE